MATVGFKGLISSCRVVICVKQDIEALSYIVSLLKLKLLDVERHICFPQAYSSVFTVIQTMNLTNIHIDSRVFCAFVAGDIIEI